MLRQHLAQGTFRCNSIGTQNARMLYSYLEKFRTDPFGRFLDQRTQTVEGSITVQLVSCLTLGNFSKPLATINFAQFSHILGQF